MSSENTAWRAPSNEALDAILDGLMQRYGDRVPDVAAVVDRLMRDGVIADARQIENDHIAFRTLGVEHLGIESLHKVFLAQGYVRRDAYKFEGKKLDAYWYSPPEPRYPRIFISELRVADLSEEAQTIIKAYTDEVTSDPVSTLDLSDPEQVDGFLHSPLWRLPTWSDYERLAQESEYASWVIYNRYYLNHFTISVHSLPTGFNTLAEFNVFLLSAGFSMNDAGGLIKASPDGLLLQSSTVAEMIEAEFASGERHFIPGSYVEFAERRPLPEFAHVPVHALTREQRREGFEARSADKIFESTYRAQTRRRSEPNTSTTD